MCMSRSTNLSVPVSFMWSESLKSAQAFLYECCWTDDVRLEEFMRPWGISINVLPRAVSVPPNRISGIVNVKRSITADTALRSLG
jgi:hypothetical protein